MRNIGVIYEETGRGEEAVSYFRRALAIYNRAFGEDHVEVGKIHTSLGDGLLAAGEHEEAIAAHEKALEIYGRIIAPDHFVAGWGYERLGLALLEAGRPEPARIQLERAVEVYERPEVPDAQLGNARFFLAKALLRSGTDRDAALAMGRAAKEAYDVDARPFSRRRTELDAWLRDPK